MIFDTFNFIICLLEAFNFLLFIRIIDDSSFKIIDYAIAYGVLLLGSMVVAFIDTISSSVLIVNFLLLFVAVWAGFKKSIKETLFNALFAFLLLLYLQSFTIVLIPLNMLGKNLGNLLGDSFILIVSLSLCIISNKFKWARYYRKNTKVVWELLAFLCIPEIVIVQHLARNFNDSSRQTIIILVLLQIIYITAIISIFSVVSHRSNYIKFLQTQKHINDLDKLLDSSRKSIHDFNKHIKYIHNLVMTNSNDNNLKTEIDDYCKNLVNIYDDEEILLQLDSPIFRALLYGRRTQAVKNQIEFVLDATPVLPKFPMENFKLVEVFDNLMDNAFECVIGLKNITDKWIKVSLSFEQKDTFAYHKLTIYNPYEEVDISRIINSKTYTSKGSSHMGIGLKKVAQLVDDTGGTLLISTDNNIFSVSIIYEISINYELAKTN